MWVNIAVAAAEQIFSVPGAGTQKKIYVIEFFKDKGNHYYRAGAGCTYRSGSLRAE